ncbi:MAG: hypothetical protein GEU86_18765 [Actinophytocola sp.]|nr:hypothetical protein [Actinophytocola sp.]
MTHGKDTIAELGQQLRVDAIRCSAAAGSGHPISSMSAADLMAVLLAQHLRLNFDEPETESNDRLIFSKGHASPLLYAMFAAATGGSRSNPNLRGVLDALWLSGVHNVYTRPYRR